MTVTPTYIPCTSSHKADKSDGYVRKMVWNKVTKKYDNWKMHRWVYTQAFGPIPQGMDIDHICHNEAVARGECAGGSTCTHRACFNIEHLRAVTRSENIKAGFLGFDNRTHCQSKGHELTKDNIYIYYRGTIQSRECLTCRRENSKLLMRKYRARKKALIAN